MNRQETKSEYKFSAGLLWRLSLALFVATLIVMALISIFSIDDFWLSVPLGAVSVVILVLPVLYFSFFLPLQQTIEEQKLFNAKSIAEEKKYQLLFETAANLITSVDSNGNLVDCNNRIEEVLGYTRDEVIGESFSKIMHPDSLPHAIQTVHDLVRDKITRNREFKMVKKDGTIIDIVINSSSITDEHGNFVRSICILNDVTERNQIQKANETLLRAIEQVDESIVITDINGSIQYANPAFEKRSGYTIEEALGKNPRILNSGAHPKEFYRVMWQTLLKDHKWQGEIINKKKDGTLYTEHVIITPVHDKDNHIINFVAAKSDITEIKRLQELESRASRLELAGTIAGQVAHDLNNLLAPIMAYPDMIRDEIDAENPAHGYLDAIETSAKKITDINQDLLTMGRRGHYNLETLNLNRIVNSVLSSIQEKYVHVTFDVNLKEELLHIKGGSSQVFRMIMNLVINAIDAISLGGKISIRTENYYVDETKLAYCHVPQGEYVKLSISDTGVGIPEDVIQKIFDPFYSTKTASKRNGSGLGLSVVDAVMKDHHGYIDVESSVGVGTTFYLYFPITRDEQIEEESFDVVGGTEKILVVDDDEVQREVSKNLLTKLGYEVYTLECGTKAVALVQQHDIDLIILDMVMKPCISGTETFKRILKVRPDQKAIIVSGFSETALVHEAMRLGVKAFVRKPLTKRSIAQAVREALDCKEEVIKVS